MHSYAIYSLTMDTERTNTSEPFDRELMRSSLELMILSVLADGAKYGYLIQKRVAQAFGTQVDLKAGTLYPLLHRLEARKALTARLDTSAGRPRKWYELTPLGLRRLHSKASQWFRLTRCLHTLIAETFPNGQAAGLLPT